MVFIRHQYSFRISQGTDMAIETLRSTGPYRRLSRSDVIERAVRQLCIHHRIPAPLDTQAPDAPSAVDPDEARADVI